MARGSRRPTTLSCTARSATSTRANGAGRIRRTPTSTRCRTSPRSFDYRVYMASSLLQTDNIADVTKARDVLREAVDDARHRRTRALPAVAGRAPERRCRQRGKRRAAVDRPERQESAWLCRAVGSARGSAALPADRGRARAGGGDVIGRQRQRLLAVDAPAAPGVCLPGARTVRQSDRDVRKRAQDCAERSVGHALSDSGADGREELLERRGARACRAVDSPQRSAPGPHGVSRPATRREGRSGAGHSRGNRSHAQRRSRSGGRAGAGIRGRQSCAAGGETAAGRPDAAFPATPPSRSSSARCSTSKRNTATPRPSSAS